jgi:biopolymer transport protein ExbD
VNIRVEDGFEEASIQLTPLIDTLFFLLLFFMVATTFYELEREIGVDLPVAESGTAPKEVPDEIVIEVFEDGRVALRGASVEASELAAALRTAAQEDPARPVTIRGDKRARHEAIVGVMDACGVAGLSNLAVGTLEDS